jgi:uncharacterized protein (TIGR02271 family)
MINSTNPAGLVGATVTDGDGDKIGKVGQVYVDPTTGQPNWATVRTGLFGTSETFVPLQEAEQDGEDIRVPYTKDFVKDAPRVDADGSIEAAEEDSLYSYYHGEHPSAATEQTPTTQGEPSAEYAEQPDVETGSRDDADANGDDDAMTRSEERLHVGTEKVEAGRARLHKYVVTEEQSVTVPVSHEEVRLEREPITEENVGAATDGPEISEADHEVVLTEERPVIQKETVPVERVSLGTETVTENEQVNEHVRKEEIEYEDSTTPRTHQ